MNISVGESAHLSAIPEPTFQRDYCLFKEYVEVMSLHRRSCVLLGLVHGETIAMEPAPPCTLGLMVGGPNAAVVRLAAFPLREIDASAEVGKLARASQQLCTTSQTAPPCFFFLDLLPSASASAFFPRLLRRFRRRLQDCEDGDDDVDENDEDERREEDGWSYGHTDKLAPAVTS